MSNYMDDPSPCCPECGFTELEFKNADTPDYDDATPGTLRCLSCDWAQRTIRFNRMKYEGLRIVESDLMLEARERRHAAQWERAFCNMDWLRRNPMPAPWKPIFQFLHRKGSSVIVKLGRKEYVATFQGMTTIDDQRTYHAVEIDGEVLVDGAMMSRLELDCRIPAREVEL